VAEIKLDTSVRIVGSEVRLWYRYYDPLSERWSRLYPSKFEALEAARRELACRVS